MIHANNFKKIMADVEGNIEFMPLKMVRSILE
jgi:hypothetical protein